MSSSSPIPQTVHLNLGPRSYDIAVGRGLLSRLGLELAARLPAVGAAGRTAIVVSSPRIARHYAPSVRQSLADAGFRVELLSLPAGERYKTLATVRRAYEFFHAQAVDRHAIVVALGGGVIGDMAGFIAATYSRGLDFVQIPTTLLGQVDSSVGGKTGVNFGPTKNLIGAFYQPRFVLIDPDTLRTLPLREHRSGLAEVIKYGIIDDKDFFNLLAREGPSLVRLASAHLEYAITRSC
ncbi:MAG: 3-dehydroquinate synthase, partial [Armatimonadota bacterium]|nr:3-dehydroquinate synthase [Armatimonadota bacterium]